MSVEWGFAVIHFVAIISNYLLTGSEDFTGKSKTETLAYWLSDSKVNTARPEVWDSPIETECSRLISCLLYAFCFVFCKPVIGLWALWENNALELASHSVRYIGHKHKPYNTCRGYHMPMCGYEFYLQVLNLISHKGVQRTGEIVLNMRKNKQACNILFTK